MLTTRLWHNASSHTQTILPARVPKASSFQMLLDVLQPRRQQHHQQRGGQQQARGTGVPDASSEVVLVQDSNSFFAYEPILKALQAATDLPLAHHILPSLPSVPGDGAGAAVAAAAAAAGPSSAAPAGVKRVEVPAYLAGGDVQYDLTLLLDRERMGLLTKAERARYAAMHVCSTQGCSGCIWEVAYWWPCGRACLSRGVCMYTWLHSRSCSSARTNLLTAQYDAFEVEWTPAPAPTLHLHQAQVL
jgi:hypothetical protein